MPFETILEGLNKYEMNLSSKKKKKNYKNILKYYYLSKAGPTTAPLSSSVIHAHVLLFR